MKKQGKKSSQLFGNLSDGREIQLFTLTNKKDVEVKITNYGATIQSILLPDGKGGQVDIAAGYDKLEAYVNDSVYFGATVGRYANRIAGGKFVLNNKIYNLAKNSGSNHLHGGNVGFNKQLWAANLFDIENGCGLQLNFSSPDGEENYPGNLDVVVIYTLTDSNELSIQYFAKTDHATHLNLTNHTYFNLKGSGDIYDTLVSINANQYTEVDEELIPTGKLIKVERTAMDFRKEKPVGLNITETGAGYDHNYVLNKRSNEISFAAKASDPHSRRSIEVYTTQPGMQFYTGNFIAGIKGKKGYVYKNHEAFCFETQHYPDSPNRPEFPSTLLKPGEVFEETTIWRFLY